MSICPDRLKRDSHPCRTSYRSWLGSNPMILSPKEWFVEGHGIIGGVKDAHSVWMPKHTTNGRVYLWTPPPVITDVALEEALKAKHKRADATHVFCIPRLYSPAWIRLLYKLSDVLFTIPVDSPLLPKTMHEPRIIGISLPYCRYQPWALRGTNVVVEMDRKLHDMLRAGEGDGWDILCKLLQLPRRILCAMSESMAHLLLQVPGRGNVHNEHAEGLRR
jgi:hypothetical protein